MRANVSGASFPSELRDLLQRRLGELEKQLLKKVSNLEEEKSMLSNATAAYRLKTESTLNALVERISELEKGNATHHHVSNCSDEVRTKRGEDWISHLEFAEMCEVRWQPALPAH